MWVNVDANVALIRRRYARWHRCRFERRNCMYEVILQMSPSTATKLRLIGHLLGTRRWRHASLCTQYDLQRWLINCGERRRVACVQPFVSVVTADEKHAFSFTDTHTRGCRAIIKCNSIFLIDALKVSTSAVFKLHNQAYSVNQSAIYTVLYWNVGFEFAVFGVLVPDLVKFSPENFKYVARKLLA